jgi:uncharacterized protein (TIGR03067 family)
MKTFLTTALILLLMSCSSHKDLTVKPGKLLGTWIPVKQEIGGTALPGVVFEKQKLILGDGTYLVIAESADKGTVQYNGNKMDIYGSDGVNAGKHFTAIYKYEDGLLTVCYNLAGDSYPDSFSTTGNPLLFLSVFKRDAVR